MKRLAVGIIAALGSLYAAWAWAQVGTPLNKNGMNSVINQNFPDNTSGQITPFLLRQGLVDIVSSMQQFGCVNAQTGTTYTFLTSDYGCLVTFSSSLNVTVTVPTASGSFNPWNAFVTNYGGGNVTISPVTGTIGGLSSFTLAPIQGVWVVSDGSNYQLFYGSGTSNALTIGEPCNGCVANGILYANSSDLLANSGAFINTTIITPTGNGQWSIGSTSPLGLVLIGKGSIDDFQLQNSVSTPVMSVPTSSTTVILSSLAGGSTQCVQALSQGQLGLSGGGCGGSGAPGGSNTQVQFNTNGAFAGISGVTSDSIGITMNTATIGNLTGSRIQFATATFTGWTTAQLAAVPGWLTASGINGQTMTLAGLTPTGPNCLQETNGIIQATNSTCGSGGGSVSGTGAAGQVALWNAGTVLTGDIGITFTSSGQLALAFTTTTLATNPKALAITGTWSSSGEVFDAPLFMNITDNASAIGSSMLDLQVGGASKFSFLTKGPSGGASNQMVGNVLAFTGGAASPATPAGSGIMNSGGAGFGTIVSGGTRWGYTDSNNWRFTLGNASNVGIQISGTGSTISFVSGAAADSGTPDTSIFRDGATTVLALGNANSNTTAATLRVYNTTDNVGTGTAPTTYERGVFDWATSANTLTIGTQAAGAGLGRTVMLVASGTKAISLSPTINLYGQTNPSANETYAVCAGSGATGLTAGGQLFVDTTTCIASSMLVKHNIAAFNDYGMTKLASLATPLHAEHRLSSAPIDIDPIAKAMALVPAVATYDTLSSSGGPEFTLIAQNVCQVDERLCERTRDGEVRSFKPNAVISILVAAFQKQQAEIDELKRLSRQR